MGHAKRMMHNRRRLIWEMTKEKQNEKNDSRQYDELSSREGEVSPSECESLSTESGRNRGTS